MYSMLFDPSRRTVFTDVSEGVNGLAHNLEESARGLMRCATYQNLSVEGPL